MNKYIYHQQVREEYGHDLLAGVMCILNRVSDFRKSPAASRQSVTSRYSNLTTTKICDIPPNPTHLLGLTMFIYTAYHDRAHLER